MEKVEKCLQIFAEKSKLDYEDNSPYKDISYLDIALKENCTEQDFIEILKTKSKSHDAMVYYQITCFSDELFKYEGFKNFNKNTQYQMIFHKAPNIEIENIENYNDIPIKPTLDYWMSYDGEILAPDFNSDIIDPEETKNLEFYTTVTNWILDHNDFKPNLPYSHPIVKWAKRLSKAKAYAYAEQGDLLLEKLGLETNKIDISEMGWMELLEHNLTIACKDLIMTKNNKIHGLVLYFYQYDFTCWCDYKENEKLSLHNIEDWINGASDEAFIDYYFGSIPYDKNNKTLSDMAHLMISIVMAKVLIKLKNDTTLNTHFSKNLKIGINFEDMYLKPIFPGNYYDSRLHSKYDKRYTPDPKIVKNIVKEYVSSEENEELITDLMKEQPTASGLELWKELA